MESGKNHRRELGLLGEELACEWLREMGHTILERNWRSGHLEVDIISYDADGIHFVEVKARRENIQAPPQDNVDLAKQRRIAKAANGFLRSNKRLLFGSGECHFDIVAIVFRKSSTQLEYIPDAYIPIYI